ncbi:hypothetical protein GALMADRAFT_139691 [Galerina marginata CBS 339.88]|uniref:Uncharacterized protein n=1 Tax=Galerina marginata (strain CBS 339.88) TaxID=685588 RepID=A0A067T3A5_GALM3|nr:hypothetical protein GALMADRAFT_139691 [Galerina marginata CBS 339.88]
MFLGILAHGVDNIKEEKLYLDLLRHQTTSFRFIVKSKVTMKIQLASLVSLAVLCLSATASPIPAESFSPSQLNAAQIAQLLAAFGKGSGSVFRRDVAAREIASADASPSINSLTLTPAQKAQLIAAFSGASFF